MNRAILVLCALLIVIFLFPSVATAWNFKETISGQSVRWRRDTIVLRLGRVDSCSDCPDREAILFSLNRSVARWMLVPGIPRITIVDDPSAVIDGLDGKNVVEFASVWPLAGVHPLANTLSSYDGDTGETLDTDIIIDGEMRFYVGEMMPASSEYDLDLVLTHEIGHVLGLGESDVNDATMWGIFTRGEYVRRELSIDDIDGITSLYSLSEDKYRTYSCEIEYGRGDGSSSLLIMLMVIIVLFCKRR